MNRFTLYLGGMLVLFFTIATIAYRFESDFFLIIMRLFAAGMWLMGGFMQPTLRRWAGFPEQSKRDTRLYQAGAFATAIFHVILVVGDLTGKLLESFAIVALLMGIVCVITIILWYVRPDQPKPLSTKLMTASGVIMGIGLIVFGVMQGIRSITDPTTFDMSNFLIPYVALIPSGLLFILAQLLIPYERTRRDRAEHAAIMRELDALLNE